MNKNLKILALSAVAILTIAIFCSYTPTSEDPNCVLIDEVKNLVFSCYGESGQCNFNTSAGPLSCLGDKSATSGLTPPVIVIAETDTNKDIVSRP